jgi:arylsulfatase A
MMSATHSPASPEPIMRWSLTALFLVLAAPLAPAQKPPNIVIIFTDDMGYGDLGCYGHPSIRTPNIDRMAAEGMKFTSFYSAAEVCTPSRAALLTGRLPIRSGMCSDTRRVLFPDSAGGLPQSEITLAEALKAKGYATACVGKWHLGHLPEYSAMSHGFDSFFGLPYVNDMDRVPDRGPKGRAAFFAPKIEYWNVPLMRGDKIIERPADQHTLTKRYTEEAVKYIKEKKDKPFFLYLAHAMPHVPLFASKDFAGKSARGLYGDVIEEIDWSVGEVLKAIRDEKLDKNTLVFFTSDNGPWLMFGEHGGSAGILRDGKGSTFEGGMRVPCIAWWPGLISGGETTHEMASTMDIFVTAVTVAGGKVPTDRPIDGYEIAPIMNRFTYRSKDDIPSHRDTMFFYRGSKLFAVRHGPWKAHFLTQPAYGAGSKDSPTPHSPPLLYHLGRDPGEKTDMSKENPDVVTRLKEIAEKHLAAMKPGEPQLEKRLTDKK